MLQMRKFPRQRSQHHRLQPLRLPAPGARAAGSRSRSKEAGNEAFAQREFSLALGHYSRALQEEPRNAVLLSNRGRMLPGA